MRMAETWKPEGRELMVEGGEKGEWRAKNVEGEKPQWTAVGLGNRTARN